jgi:hypothetical protein
MSKIAVIALALSTLYLACMRITFAQDAPPQPSRGIAYRDNQPSAMMYECEPATSRSMSCRFTELHVWKPLRAVATNDEQRRTCTFAAHNFAQTFRRGGTADAPTWIATTGPYGACGFTRESRFVGEKQTNGMIFWSYVAQFKVANKSVDEGALRCAELREFDERYDWQPQEHREDCGTIHFGPACSSDDFPCLGDGPIVVH